MLDSNLTRPSIAFDYLQKIDEGRSVNVQMPRFILVAILATTLPVLSVLAQCAVIETVTTFITITTGSPAATATSSSSMDVSSSGVVNPSLIPPFGVTPGILLNDGTPRCAGNNGIPIECDCPPDYNNFLNAVETAVAGGAEFPTGQSCP